MLQQLNQSLKDVVPYYNQVSQLSVKRYNETTQMVNSVSNQFCDRLEQSKKNIRQIEKKLTTNILSIVNQASNDILSKVENLILKQNEKLPSEDRKQLKKRFRNIFRTIMREYIIFYAEQAKKFNMAVIKRGRQYVFTTLFPLYIKLKATILVSKEILMEILETRFDQMKMTYSVSKDTVTMLISGKFEEEKFIEKIKVSMENFKELTVKTVKKGLQIKVDKQSLYENYETFSSKLLETIREMREKGAERIISAKQKTAELYQNVLRRIRQKEISLRMECKEIEDEKQTSTA